MLIVLQKIVYSKDRLQTCFILHIISFLSALIAIRDRHIEARRQQQPDSGHGTSVNDSESESDSLNCSSSNLPRNGAADNQVISGDSSSSVSEPDEGVPGK